MEGGVEGDQLGREERVVGVAGCDDEAVEFEKGGEGWRDLEGEKVVELWGEIGCYFPHWDFC